MPLKGKNSFNFILGVFYLFVFFILVKNSFSYLDPDFGWHFKVGEEIWHNKAVPVVEHYDYTLAGRTWVDHEWLMNLITYFINHNFGYIVLSIFFALLMTVTLLIQLQFIRKYFLEKDQGIILVLFLQALGVYAASPHFGVRMQEVSVLCLLVLTSIIFIYNKNKNPLILFWLPLLFLFWASAHGGFLAGLAVLTMFIGVKLFELISAKKFPFKFLDYEKVLNFKQIAVVAFFFGLSFLATLCTPYGWRLYELFWGYRDNFYQSHISEWLGEYVYPFQYTQLVYLEIILLFFVLTLFSILVFKNERLKKIDLWSLSLIGVFFILSFKARRHFPLLFIVSLPILAKFFIEFFHIKFVFGGGAKIKNRFISTTIAILYVVVILIAAFSLTFCLSNKPEKYFQDSYPYEAVKFLRAHPEWNERKIFNEYGWGGYLIWQYPERKLFIDGRLPQYELNGHSLLAEYFDFSDKEKAAAKLKNYDIGLALIKIKRDSIKIHWWDEFIFLVNEKEITNSQKASLYLRDYLASSNEWQSVYNDGLAQIFIKK
jgi:hypothetical protein